MALFTRTKKEVPHVAAPRISIALDVSHVLREPRITEKGTAASGMSVYVFNVAPHATKREIKIAVERYYKVVPRTVRVVSIRPKQVRNVRSGKSGVKRGGKKAYVYLKKGETITIA